MHSATYHEMNAKQSNWTGGSSASKEKSRRTEWLVIIGVAVLLHVLLFLYIQPGFFSAFKKTISEGAGETADPSSPYAIITIPVEIEDERETKLSPDPSTEESDELPDPDRITEEAFEPASSQRSSSPPVDIESLLGEAPQTLPSGGAEGNVTIQPRPVEITWPDTRDLKHCLGHDIDVKIHVSETGDIIEVKPTGTGPPADCIEAALESARRIVFEPGVIDGKPTRMWTHVRIQFKRKG